MPRRRRQTPPVPAVTNQTGQDQAILDSGNVTTTTQTDVGGDLTNTVTTTGITGDQLADILAAARADSGPAAVVTSGNPFTDALMANLMEHSDVNATVAADRATALAPSRLVKWALLGVGILITLAILGRFLGGGK